MLNAGQLCPTVKALQPCSGVSISDQGSLRGVLPKIATIILISKLSILWKFSFLRESKNFDDSTRSLNVESDLETLVPSRRLLCERSEFESELFMLSVVATLANNCNFLLGTILHSRLPQTLDGAILVPLCVIVRREGLFRRFRSAYYIL